MNWTEFKNNQFKIKKSVSTTTGAMLFVGLSTLVDALFVFLKGLR